MLADPAFICSSMGMGQAVPSGSRFFASTDSRVSQLIKPSIGENVPIAICRTSNISDSDISSVGKPFMSWASRSEASRSINRPPWGDMSPEPRSESNWSREKLSRAS